MVFKKKIEEQMYELKRNSRPPVGEGFQGEQFPVEEEYVLEHLMLLSRYSFLDMKWNLGGQPALSSPSVLLPSCQIKNAPEDLNVWEFFQKVKFTYKIFCSIE